MRAFVSTVSVGVQPTADGAGEGRTSKMGAIAAAAASVSQNRYKNNSVLKQMFIGFRCCIFDFFIVYNVVMCGSIGASSVASLIAARAVGGAAKSDG